MSLNLRDRLINVVLQDHLIDLHLRDRPMCLFKFYTRSSFVIILSTPYSVCYHQNLTGSFTMRSSNGVLDCLEVTRPSHVLAIFFTIFHFINRIPFYVISYMSPFQKLYGYAYKQNIVNCLLIFHYVFFLVIKMAKKFIIVMILPTKNSMFLFMLFSLSIFHYINFLLTLTTLQGLISLY